MASDISLVGVEINFSVDFGTSFVVVPASLLVALVPWVNESESLLGTSDMSLEKIELAGNVTDPFAWRTT